MHKQFTWLQRALGIVLSASMTLSLLPAQAIAEMEDELADVIIESLDIADEANKEIDASGAEEDARQPQIVAQEKTLSAANETSDAYLGVFGSCSWSIDGFGQLSIWPSDGVSGELPSPASLPEGSYWPWWLYHDDITSIEIKPGVKTGESVENIFLDETYLKSVDLTNLDTSACVRFSGMFARCSSIESIDLSGIDLSHIVTCKDMFSDCRSLTGVAFPGDLNMDECTDRSFMFKGCSSLQGLDLTNFTAGASTKMFDGVGGLLWFRVGANTFVDPNVSFPSSCYPNGAWYSHTDGAWYTAEQIIDDRTGVADLYTYCEGEIRSADELTQARAAIRECATRVRQTSSDNLEVVQVSLGTNHSGALLSDGSLWMWGSNNHGQLGDGTTTDSKAPICVMDDVIYISLGRQFSSAIKSDGSLWTWGWNNIGQIGNGLSNGLSEDRSDVHEPVRILEDVVWCSAGIADNMTAVTSDGSFYIWGDGYYGQLGNGSRGYSSFRKTPGVLMPGIGIAEMGGGVGAAVYEDRSLWTWGHDDPRGVTGMGEESGQFAAMPTRILNDVSNMAVGLNCSGAIRGDASLWAWGNGQAVISESPMKLAENVVQVAASKGDGLAYIKSDGTLWTLGDNSKGQLGNGTTESTCVASALSFGDFDIAAERVSLGEAHGAAILADGSLWIWGDNSSGQLGDGTTDASYEPTCVFADGNWAVRYAIDRDEDEDIVDIVRRYTSGNMAAQYYEIVRSNEPIDVKRQRYWEFFNDEGFLNPLEGVKFISSSFKQRDNYGKLLCDELFLSHNYAWDLNNTESGKKTKKALDASGFFILLEFTDYLDIPAIVFDQEIPGIKEYEELLYDFMEDSELQIERAAAIKQIEWVTTLSKKVTDTAKAEAETLIRNIQSSASIEEIEKIMSSAEAKSILWDVNYDSNRGEYYSVLNSDSGFGQFAAAMGKAADYIDFAVDTWDNWQNILMHDRAAEMYMTYKTFLIEVSGSVDLPRGMRLAAVKILNDLSIGIWHDLASMLEDCIVTTVKLTGKKKVLSISYETFRSAVEKHFGMDAAGAAGNYIFWYKLVAWCIDKTFGISGLRSGVRNIEGYDLLCTHYKNKLISDAEMFQLNETASAAWLFYRDYNILWRLRIKAELAYQGIYNLDSIYWKTIRACGYVVVPYEAASKNIEMIKELYFDLDEHVEVPESMRFATKFVLDCPVDVDVYAPDGTLIATLKDGVETDEVNEHGEFIVTYRAWTGEWAKVICLYDEGDYSVVTHGTDLGLMSMQMASQGDANVYSLDNVEVDSGTSVRASVIGVAEGLACELDADADGEYESTIPVHADDPYESRIEVTSISLTDDAIELGYGESALLGVVAEPEGATCQNVSWISLDESVATVKNGKVSAVGGGTTKVLCVAQDNGDLIAECEVTVIAPSFRTHALLLSGQIGVRFYTDLSPLTEEELASCEMEFTVDGRTVTDPFDPTDTNASGKYHGFTCFITSAEMADEITATLRWGDGRSISQTYSASRYVEDFEAVADRFDAESVSLVHAIADYGHYMQPFLADARNWEIGVDHVEMPGATELAEADVSEAREATDGYGLVRDIPEDSDVKRVNFSIDLDSTTSMFFYLTLDEGSTIESATLDGSTVLEPELRPDGRWRLAVRDISAHQLGDEHTILVETSGGGELELKASALSYVRVVLNSDSFANNENALMAVTALWRYYVATVAYKETHRA